MKVAFYLHNSDFSETRDFSEPMLGNPGIGGSEYMILLVSYILAKRNNGIQVRLYVQKSGMFNHVLDVDVISSVFDAAIHADKDGFERFVFDHKRISWHDNPFPGLTKRLKLIPWCHCFTFTRELQQISKHPNVGRIVYVGREQMDLMRDDKSFLISDYIYNCFTIKDKWIELAKLTPNERRNHNVVYMGSLVPLKSFHVLAEMWKRILRRVPDAELYVIGSASVYGDNVTLGKFGVAVQTYEDSFAPYLTDNNGFLLPSVHFCGAMGEQKYEILSKAKVGVPNPTGKSETFCLCAVEMQAMGCSVVAMQAPGYYDTFCNGELADSLKDLEEKIVELLIGPSPKTYMETIDYLNGNFGCAIIAEEWENLLCGDLKNAIHSINPMSNKFYRCKWLKEVLRILKLCLPFLYRVPITVESVYNRYTKNLYNKIAYHS